MDAAPSETNARIKSTARIAIGIAITVVTLYVVYRDTDPQQMLDAIGEFNLVYAPAVWALLRGATLGKDRAVGAAS